MSAAARRAAVVLAFVLVALGALAASGPGTAAPGSPHVARAGERAYISDGRGRELLLRGINSNALVQYPDYFQQTVPLRRADIAEMAALGFNFLRLPISWSRLEPAPGRFSGRYLATIERIVGWAESEGMWVLVDFHQDRYNRHLRPGDEADGAPDWATFTDGQPCEEAFFLSPCSIAAYDNFWTDRETAGQGLQGHYLDALLAVSRRLRADRRLLGLELMNEPTFGSTTPPAFEREQLWPFERRMIRGLRADGEQRMIWFEPNILRDTLDYDSGDPERFSRDRNLVYAPHIYTGTFNGGDTPQLEASYAAAAQEARTYGAAWVDDEWGGGSDPKAERLRAENLALQDRYRVGGAFWMWKQRPGFYDWQTVEPDGALRDDSLRAQQLSRPHVDAVPGRLGSTAYSDGLLRARVRGRRGGVARLWSGTVVRRGGATLLERPLVRAFVDGKPVRERLRAKAFRTDAVALRGYRVRVPVPPGLHDIELRPGTP